MNLQFETIQEYREFFDIPEGETAFPKTSTVFNVNGKSYQPVCFSSSNHHMLWGASVEMTLVRIFPKSKEQIAAEEAVDKAKEALKAAEAALKAVKDKESK